MSVDGIHDHPMTPEEAHQTQRGVDGRYIHFYCELEREGFDTVPRTAAEIIVDGVRKVICPGKKSPSEKMDAMLAAAQQGLQMTSTIIYGYVESKMHHLQHL